MIRPRVRIALAIAARLAHWRRLPHAAPLLLMLLIAGMAPAGLAAQVSESSTLAGIVTDESGQPQSGADVFLVHPAGITFSATTNEDGRFLLRSVPAAAGYEVRVEFFGYKTAERTLSLRGGETHVIRFELEASPIALEELRVQAEANPQFARERTGASLTLDEESLQSQPTVERDLIAMAEVSPVVSRTDQGGISITGQNSRYNSILIDGALHQDVFGASAAGSGVPGGEARARALPMDAVQNLEVEAAPFDVRRSGFTGGLLNAVTKSGGEEWSGSFSAEFRDETFFGDLVLDGSDLAPASYGKYLVSGSVGGPIIEDRLRLFIAAEVDLRDEPPLGYSLGSAQPVHTRIAADSADRVAAILRDQHGLDTRQSRSYGLDNLRGNVFSRVDWRISPSQLLSGHVNLVTADRDLQANRSLVGPYEFASSGYHVASTTLGTKLQLRSRLNDRLTNDLLVNYQRTRDRQDPAEAFPQIDVDVASSFDDRVFRRTLRAGSSYLVQQSAVDQDVLQLENELTWDRNELTTIIGTGVELFRFRHDYLPGALGYFEFDSMEALELNTPSGYEVTLVQEDAADATARFTVAQPTVLVQNEHHFPGGLVMYYGIRADMPIFPDAPVYNAEIDEVLGLRTDELPSGHLLVSPRMGLNWQSEEGRYTTQVRGGVGAFTGRLPYVWLANAYSNTGTRSAVLVCNGDAAPVLTGDDRPTECADGSTVSTAGLGNAVVFHPDFEYPRELKASMAIDQQLPFGLTASAEVLIVQTLAQVIVNDLNLASSGPKDAGYQQFFGWRLQYGDPVAPTGYEQRRLVPGYAHILQMDNEETSGFAHAVTLGLESRIGDDLVLSGSYSFNHSDDVQSLRSGDALRNFASNPISRDPNQLGRRPSAFNRPWKAVVNARARMPWTNTQLSVLYIAEAGQAYSYVYEDDINGDGYPGPGIQLDESNDLLYVPRDIGDLRAGFATYALFEDLIEREPCLQEHRGGIVPRNACWSPEVHRVDVQLSQPVTFGGTNIELTGTLLNVLNLIDDEWGRVIHVPARVPVLALGVRERVPPSLEPSPDGRVRLEYVGPVAYDAELGRARSALPHTVLVPESQWQMQLGVRVRY